MSPKVCHQQNVTKSMSLAKCRKRSMPQTKCHKMLLLSLHLNVKPRDHVKHVHTVRDGNLLILRNRRQSYERNLVLKKTKFVLNFVTVHYLNLDLSSAGMSNSNYLAVRKSIKNCWRAAKVLKLSYVGHILQNLEFKNDFAVFYFLKMCF